MHITEKYMYTLSNVNYYIARNLSNFGKLFVTLHNFGAHVWIGIN